MKKILYIVLIILFTSNASSAKNIKEAYFAGGCFWCLEEFFEQVKGVEEVISGYSGGNTQSPTYKEVTYGNTGHFEAAKIIYDENIINYKELLNFYWQNIDPFDASGQFWQPNFLLLIVLFSGGVLNGYFYTPPHQKVGISHRDSALNGGGPDGGGGPKIPV